MPTERRQADIANQTEREQARERLGTEVYRIREPAVREHMCVDKASRGDIDPSRWSVDQRPFVWASTSQLTNDKVPGSPLWTTGTDVPQSPVTSLPYAPYASGLATTGGEAESDFKSSECSTPVPRAGKVLQSRVWEPELNGGQATAPTMRSVFRCPQSFPASRVGILQSNMRITFMPVVQELTYVRHSVDVWESSTSKEGGSQRSSSWVEDLIEEDRVQNVAPLRCALSSGSAYTGKTSKIIHHATHSSRPPHTNKAQRATASKDTVSVIESLSDNDDQSEEEGVQVVTEKRRKRMLSNRASAQRSRQRRQERLDTLEVLVAELRVENSALSRRANLAALAAKKTEKENKTLRDRLGKKERLPLSDTSNESDKTTENSDMAGNNNNNGGAARPYGASIEPTRNHGSSSADTGETNGDDSYSRPSSPASKIRRDDDKAGKDNSKTWNDNISSSSFDFEFNSDPMESDAEAFCGGRGRGEGTLNKEAEVPEVVNAKDLYQSAMMNLSRTSSFRNLDSFGIELEERNQEMDKKNLDSRSVEDIWLDSLANCLT